MEEQITKDWTIGKILEKYPNAAEIMFKNGLHCVGCHIAANETLEQGIISHGGSEEMVGKIVSEINDLIKKASKD